jgi:Uma2 family endonuclease
VRARLLLSLYWIVDSDTLTIEEYHATPEGYLRTASIAAGEEFHPRLFPGTGMNLTALLGVTPPSVPSP